MLNLNSKSQIYVFCPAGGVTGGVELLHQLVSLLNDSGRDAYIIYIGTKAHTIPTDYSSYNIKLKEENQIIDAPYNVQVLSEAYMHKAVFSKKIQSVIWWLSVDNFYYMNEPHLTIKDAFDYSFKRGLSITKLRLFSIFKGIKYDIYKLSDIQKGALITAFQSEYAQHYLQDLGFNNLYALKDYINTDHHNDNYSLRKDIVLYNPAKGFEFTQKLIKVAPHINWTPIKSMTRHQVIELMGKAKVYIDFGLHPGKDRLPRECAMNGLCIITGMKGAAAFYEDICIPAKYKFDERTCNKMDVIHCIEDLLINYETRIKDFSMYSRRIQEEKSEFESQVKILFDC
ncbi:MAG: hypothetical protein LIO93_04040 [Bacteroidales bacterium]|nr:hypothetical protein [Bacteroidales bacterium]